MKSLSRWIPAVLLAALPLAATSCKREEFSPEKAAFAAGEDLVMKEEEAYRHETRQFYNTRNFDQLEARANEARTSKEKFGNGCWRLHHFYDSLDCREDEPESMWQLHEQIHQDWEKKFPDSITARIAHADFFTSYAWHARGTGYANEVTEDGWRLFHERLTSARTLLDQSKDLPVKCPVWWQVSMKVALGQSWTKAEFAKLFDEAKTFEPAYYQHDLAQAKFLMTRWYGAEGDWEAAAEKEIDRPGGLGLEGYARVIADQRGYYDDIFSETKASWRKTQQGFELLRKTYPDSAEILNAYARLAVIAEDRALAKRLFAQIGDKVILYCWGGERKRFVQMKRWAEN
ncbi:MAG: DUF4034 domain-containing protein [Luteolibacter sp.]